MIHNPSKIRWSAVTERVDGTPVDGEISYEMWLNGERFMTLPASLNPEGQFEAPLTIEDFGHYTVHLTAVESWPDGKSKESAPSNAIEFVITAAPKAPVVLAVE